jgi:hypothetical protein
MEAAASVDVVCIPLVRLFIHILFLSDSRFDLSLFVLASHM